MKRVTVDGNFAAANIAYMFNDAAFIYPCATFHEWSFF